MRRRDYGIATLACWFLGFLFLISGSPGDVLGLFLLIIGAWCFVKWARLTKRRDYGIAGLGCWFLGFVLLVTGSPANVLGLILVLIGAWYLVKWAVGGHGTSAPAPLPEGGRPSNARPPRYGTPPPQYGAPPPRQSAISTPSPVVAQPPSVPSHRDSTPRAQPARENPNEATNRITPPSASPSLAAEPVDAQPESSKASSGSGVNAPAVSLVACPECRELYDRSKPACPSCSARV